MPSSVETRLSRLRSDHLYGGRAGLFAVCSARREVLEAAIAFAREAGSNLLVEATSNQVNPSGGYTGKTPAAFASLLQSLSAAMGLPPGRLILGADHLGPFPWRHEPAEKAMERAAELARQCAAAGYAKIHLDTATACADDPEAVLPFRTVAERTADLCRAAESAAEALPAGRPRPLYVIGAEVPPPGGSLGSDAPAPVTPVDWVAETLRETETAFRARDLQDAWNRVMGIVVQPGVDFGDETVSPYRPERAAPLSEFHSRLPGIMTYEVHSTDFQPPRCLRLLVRDHFPILKVGPRLTFAFREAVFALERIEEALSRPGGGPPPSRLSKTIEAAMLENPVHWRSHYRGSEAAVRFLRVHSYRDRIRFYWSSPAVEEALERLRRNLAGTLPASLVREFFPDPPEEGTSSGHTAEGLIRRRIQEAIAPYGSACAQLHPKTADNPKA